MQLLEGRDVPALAYWTNTSLDGQFGNAANWSSGSVPTDGDDVVFGPADDASRGGDCYGFVPASSGSQYNSVVLLEGYVWTVTVTGGFSTRALGMYGGTIDQPGPGTDITVTSAFAWTGGTINSTAHVATLTVTGGTGLIAPGGGTLNLGSNIEVINGAVTTQSEGVISVADGVGILVTALGKWLVDPGVLKVATVNVSINPAVVKQIDIGPGGVLQVLSGTFDTKLGIKNAGGSFVLDAGTVAKPRGSVAGVPLFPTFVQTAGVTYIAVDAELDVGAFEAVMSGGILSIKCGVRPVGYTGYNIRGGVTLSGASVEFDPAGGLRSEFGTFTVLGTVKWTAGTYHYYVDASGPGTVGANSDVWDIVGSLRISGTASVVVTAIDSSDGDRVVAPPRKTWEMFRSFIEITAAGNTPGLPAGWKIAKDTEFPDKIWRAEYTG